MHYGTSEEPASLDDSKDTTMLPHYQILVWLFWDKIIGYGKV
jgi:hypothetical protein